MMKLFLMSVQVSLAGAKASDINRELGAVLRRKYRQFMSRPTNQLIVASGKGVFVCDNLIGQDRT